MTTDLNGAEALMVFGMQAPSMALPVFNAATIDDTTVPALARFLDAHVPTSATSSAAVFAGEKSLREQRLVQLMSDHYHKAAITLNTYAHQPEMGFNLMRTLRRSPTWACQHELPFAGQRVFVVGAGASLDDFADVLPELAKRGHVLCSNTGVGALRAAGVTPDAVTYCERMHMQHHLDGYEGAVVLDARASQQAWDAARRPLCCSQRDHEIDDYLARMRVAPLKYEISAFNCAVAQAFAWGAAEAVILGASFCIFPGAAYAKGSAHEGTVETVEGGQVVERGKVGVSTERAAPVLDVPAIGGGTVQSPMYFGAEIQSLAETAARVPIRNLNRRGVLIPNTTPITLDEVLAMPVMAERYDFTRAISGVDAGTVLADIEAACRAFLDAPTANPRGSAAGLLRFFARRALMLQGMWEPEERTRKLIDAMGLGAVGVLDVMDGEE